MSRRFYVPAVEEDRPIRLGKPESHHLLRVMRAEPGHAMRIFDGTGREFQATLTAVVDGVAEVQIQTELPPETETSQQLTLAVALPKGDRQRWLVEKCVELGVHQLLPVIAQRSVAQPTDKALDRLKRQVVEASKQCGRNTLMTIGTPQKLSTLVASTEWEQRMLAHPNGPPFTPSANSIDSALVLIGPEGGFSDEEVGLALEHDWQLIGLGDTILRVETAAIAVAAITLLGGRKE